jgi:hypothetical protein
MIFLFQSQKYSKMIYSVKGTTRFRKRMSLNQHTSDDTQSRRHSDAKYPGDTAISDNAEGSPQTIRSPVALDIKHPLPSLVATDSENIQTQGQDAKDTRALPTLAAGLRDLEREEQLNLGDSKLGGSPSNTF